MKVPVVRFDAPFWIALLACVILVGSIGCIGLAVVAQNAAKSTAGIVGMDDS